MLAASRSPWTSKLLWFVLPGVVGSLAWWWGISQFVTGQVNLSANALANISGPAAIALVGLGLWLGSTCGSTYMASWRSARVVMAAGLVLPLLALFPLTMLTGLAFLVAAGGLAWSGEQAFGDHHNRLAVQPWQTLNQNVSLGLTAVMVAVAILSYQQVTRSTGTSIATTERLSGQMVTLVEKFLPTIYHGYQPTMTVDELIGSQLPEADRILSEINFDQLATQAAQQQALNQKLKDIGLDPNQVNVDVRQGAANLRLELASQLNVYRQEAITQTRQQLATRFDLALRGNELMHDVLTDYVNQRLTTSLGKYTSFLPGLLAVGVFLLLRLFSFFYTWIIVGWGWLWLAALRRFGVLAIATTTVPAQHLEWVKRS